MKAGHCLVALPLLALCTCNGAPAPLRAATASLAETPAASASDLGTIAALLAAADAARDPAERAEIVARLDALGVHAAEGSGDDPLAAWRAGGGTASRAVFRGRALGPAYQRARIGAGEALSLDQIFYAGERAEMAASARGGQPIGLAVANARSGNVCEIELAPQGQCRWLPLFTERFSIRLENHGDSAASVYLVFR